MRLAVHGLPLPNPPSAFGAREGAIHAVVEMMGSKRFYPLPMMGS